MPLDKEQQTSLWYLRWHWEDLYRVETTTGEAWSAVLLANPAKVLTADSPMELRTKMQNDYARRAGRRSAGGCSS